MHITFESFSEKTEYQSLLVINAEDKWKETLYFTFFTPWGEQDERLYAGRYMADVHHKKKPCKCVYVFDFHRWNSETLKSALQLELPPTAFDERLQEILERSLEERERAGDSFKFKMK